MRDQRRQRRDRLLDRERRPDGRAHRRLGHRRAAADADRPPLPAAARPGDDRDPRGRRRDGRLQRAVRGQRRDRGDPRDRDEPARLALLGARLEGHRLPDREDRRAPGRRLSARGDRQRHHRRHAGLLRADDRLRRRQVAALRLREVPRRGPDALDAHEVGGRDDGDRAHLPAGLRQGAAVARARQATGRRRPERAGAHAATGAPLSRSLRGRARAAAPRREHRGDARADEDRPLVPRRAAGARARPSRAVRRRALVHVGRHVRRRVPRAHALLLLRLGALGAQRGQPRRARHRSRRPRALLDRDPRLRSQPDRPGDRVRLLLRARGDDRARLRHGGRDDQLQPRDGLDRLRHLRPAVLRAAHARARAGGRAKPSSRAG